MSNERKTIAIENAHLFFKNFSGEQTAFNRAGDRNFCVFIDPEIAPKLKEDGWNIRMLNPRDDGDEPRPYIQVKVSYKNIPPRIYLMTSRKKRMLDEETVGELDIVDIQSCDLIITPYEWTINGKSGISAYLKTMYVVMEEDEFAAKYAEMEYPGEAPF